ncbi:hypothetical protein CVT24_013114 [Panaeolus cyanescens]|uniref:Uncharacterized protein n=1 Tax=Panaeolus cyanescens TaxID=181874 RepID=A0A409YN92_9AGAR|nr:hypothetical protein CVT24_013114 [Panaeolus cyanescens]
MAPALTQGSETTPDAVAWTFNKIFSGCLQEVSVLLSIDLDKVVELETLGNSFHPSARRVACLWESGQNCGIKSLTALETFLGKPLSAPNLIPAFKRLASALDSSDLDPEKCNSAIGSGTKSNNDGILFNLNDYPADLFCTDCNKAIFNAIRNDVLLSPQLLSGDINPRTYRRQVRRSVHQRYASRWSEQQQHCRLKRWQYKCQPSDSTNTASSALSNADDVDNVPSGAKGNINQQILSGMLVGFSSLIQ